MNHLPFVILGGTVAAWLPEWARETHRAGATQAITVARCLQEDDETSDRAVELHREIAVLIIRVHEPERYQRDNEFYLLDGNTGLDVPGSKDL